jgi:hypothetical protein
MCCPVEDEWPLTSATDYCYWVAFVHLALRGKNRSCHQHDRGFDAFAYKYHVCRKDAGATKDWRGFVDCLINICFFAFELRFMPCSQDATRLASWHWIQMSQCHKLWFPGAIPVIWIDGLGVYRDIYHRIIALLSLIIHPVVIYINNLVHISSSFVVH